MAASPEDMQQRIESAFENLKQTVMTESCVMYSTSVCPWCDRAADFFQDIRRPCRKIELDSPEEGREERQILGAVLASATNMRTVPNIFLRGRHVGGYDRLPCGLEPRPPWASNPRWGLTEELMDRSVASSCLPPVCGGRAIEEYPLRRTSSGVGLKKRAFHGDRPILTVADGAPQGTSVARQSRSQPPSRSQTLTSPQPSESADVLEDDVRDLHRIFDVELRQAAFRLADEDGLGTLSTESCRCVLRSLASTPAGKDAMDQLELPSQVGLEEFLRIADSCL